MNSDIAATEYVFVDESGGAELQPAADEQLDYYVICGVCFPADRLAEYEQKATAIVREHAGEGELKSDKIGSNSLRRENVLKDIGRYDFPFYCLVVNKQRILKDSGLRWRPSSYKFLHKMLYKKLLRNFIGIHVTADNYGSSEFMDSFKRYIQSQASLFNKVEFAQSSDMPLLQIADVIAGSVRRVFLNQDPVDLIEAIGYPSLCIEEWPPYSSSFVKTKQTNLSDEYDDLIVNIALNVAREFVEAKLDSDEQIQKLQAETVRYLLHRFNQDPTEYIYRYEIASYLKELTGETISNEYVSRALFSAARDDGVILVSTDKGVKIPYTADDVSEWINRVNSQIAPYLKRIEDARRTIMIASHNKYDIVHPEAHPDLWNYLNRLRIN